MVFFLFFFVAQMLIINKKFFPLKLPQLIVIINLYIYENENNLMKTKNEKFNHKKKNYKDVIISFLDTIFTIFFD